MRERSSRISGFYNLSVEERQAKVTEFADLNSSDINILNNNDSGKEDLVFSLPLGIATNFLINNKDYLIPMVVEESSVIAAASNAARIFRSEGGIFTEVNDLVVSATVNLPIDEFSGRMVEAAVFAEVDPYRASTHNKGIMNGIDALVIATGNDFGEAEILAHSFAVRDGQYKSLSTWRIEEEKLTGEINLPILVLPSSNYKHPTAVVCRKILGNPSLLEINKIAAAVGLAQNFAALRALTTDGIQKGHMRMHQKQIDIAKGSSKPD